MKHQSILTVSFFLLLGILSSSAQVYSELTNQPKDTLDYHYLLPIFGKKVKALGFDLPYSAGISLNY
jgi:hypothetical protein